MAAPIFEQTYQDYLQRIAGKDLSARQETLGIRVLQGSARIALFGRPYQVSGRGISGPAGERPTLDICVILCQYLLRAPAAVPRAGQWLHFRDFRDAGPLTVYFAQDVERPITGVFGGRLSALVAAARAAGGYPPAEALPYHLAVQFDALPRVPLLLLFNDADEEFPADCRVLFEQRAERFLDAESLAMLARLLARELKTAIRSATAQA